MAVNSLNLPDEPPMSRSRRLDCRVLSLGGGVQSSAIAILSHREDNPIPRPHYTLFADTGAEPAYTYEWLERLDTWMGQRGGEIITVDSADLGEDLKDGDDVPIPAHTESGLLQRHCTANRKIRPIRQKIRDLLGYGAEENVKESVGVMLGITTDEIRRVSTSQIPWIEHLYPLLDLEISREDCREIYQYHRLPEPKKSACTFCPYRSGEGWRQLREHDPEGFREAVEVDEAIREKGYVDTEAYIHRDKEKLDDVDFGDDDDFAARSCGAFCGT